MARHPKYSEFPLNPDDPFRSAWGLRLKYGKDDQLGFMNCLTDEVVHEAAKEIETGTRISLNWPMDAQGDIPFFGRQVFHKNIYSKPPRIVNDETWTFNTQGSSQWDGRHFAYQKESKFYNGVTMDDICTTDCYGNGPTPLKHLQAVAESQGVEFEFGDILIIRSGYVATYTNLDRSELESLSKDNFSVVASDQPSFEFWPSQQPHMLHEVMLAGWGCPIGELFNLEASAEQCKKINRYSFFVASELFSPLIIPAIF
ncbi:hypothetical protein K432DRAFT_431022 [Lepidopterella palustris CBS 459.81]|uniref:Cyclase n=1 Tax=Lepidopterella palustris CBS 459.81 TaxID=1314670 RepID=A0A8E2EM30_9PEZI|nr:hypothetical protein K432DRAFT_431022 [Lepidopterella palustris CBS 459.81]